MNSDTEVLEKASELLDVLRAAGLRVATAESCTGGLLAVYLTEAPGSSDIVEGGIVTYSNEAKHALLGVPFALLEAHGAVSEPVARAMAEGVLDRTRADLSVAITGVAGPAGGTPEKPVGLVHFAAARRAGATHVREERYGNPGRGAIRLASVATALDLLCEAADG